MSCEHPRCVKARRGFSVTYRGKSLLSTVDPIAQAERVAEAAPLREGTLYLCPSPLFGYGLPRLLERIEGGGPDSAILAVEADRELLALSLNQGGDCGPQGPPAGDPEGGISLIPSLCSHPRFCFLGMGAGGELPGAAEREGPGLERIRALARRRWGSRRFRRVEVVRFSGAWQLYPDWYHSLAEALRGDIATDWANAMTLVKLGRRYMRNALRNLALIPRCPPVSRLSFGARPVLVAGAGPSLDPFLDAWGPPGGDGGQERPWRIICVDTAIPSLKARGIRPDLAVALESQHWNLRDFVGARGWGIPLAMDLSALPATGDALGGPRFLFFTPWTDMAFFTRLAAAGLLPGEYPPLGSVGLSAAALALTLTRGPVLVCGIDFSFTLDSYHARSSPGHRERLRRQNRFTGILNQAAAFRAAAFAVRSKSGAPARSDPAMRNYRDLFAREFSGEERLRDIDGPGLPLGIPSLSPGEAAAILGAGGYRRGDESPAEPGGPGYDPEKARRLRDFILDERGALETLRGILGGERAAEGRELDRLLDFCDYLWAHFPECAAAGGRRPAATDLTFLKRVRTEIDPFIALFDQAAAALP